MTQAMKTYGLSKLDIFTPNQLHRDLPRLSIRSYSVHGNPAVMIGEADLIARHRHICALLGPRSDEVAMRRRPKAHDRLMMHACWHFNIDSCTWEKTRLFEAASLNPKSMRTLESRNEYVRLALKTEWAMMGAPQW